MTFERDFEAKYVLIHQMYWTEMFGRTGVLRLCKLGLKAKEVFRIPRKTIEIQSMMWFWQEWTV